jgi:hypothetical protein
MNSTRPLAGSLYSTLGLPKFTNFLRDISYLSPYTMGIMVGLLLGELIFDLPLITLEHDCNSNSL